MSGHPWPERGKPIALLAALVVGCASAPVISAREAADANDTGGALHGKDELERAVLRQAPALPSGAARRVREATVLAEAPYTAASGRTCRALHVQVTRTQYDGRRLACTEGTGWFFVPDVFGENNTRE